MSRILVLISSAVVLGLAPGCGDDERVAPVDGAGGAGTTSASSGASGSTGTSDVGSSSSTGSGPVLRTVFERNPFGSQVDNLLADGDFELSFGFAGQQGWVGFSADAGQVPLVAETGGICRSGLRCAKVAAGGLLFARGTTAPNEQQTRAVVWVKPPPGGTCVGVSVQAIGCDSFFPKATLVSAGGVGDDGWCSFGGVVAGSKVATCLYVENDSGQTMIFDDASLVAVPADEAPRPAPSPPPVVDAATWARMERVRDRIRDTLPIGRPPTLPPGAKRLPGRSYAEDGAF